jgi:hypothetical protein
MSSITDLFTANTQEAQDASTKVSNIFSEISAASSDLMDTILGTRDSRGDTALSLETRELGALEAQNKKSQTYLQVGMGGEGSAKISNQLAEVLRTSVLERNAAAQEVADKKSVGLFDNPIEFLVNQFTLPDSEDKLEAANVKVSAAADSMGKINSFLQQTAQTENEYATTRTAASIQSQTSALQNELKVKSLSANIEALRLNAQGVESVFKLNSVQLDNAVKQFTVQAQQESLAYQREARAGMAQQRQLNTMLLQEKLDQIQDVKEGNAIKAQYVQYAMIKSGVPEDKAILEVNANNVDRLLKLPGEVGKKYQLLMEMGSSAAANQGVITLGDNPVEVLTSTARLGLRRTPEQEQVYNIVKSAYEQSAAVNKDKKTLPATAETRLSEIVTPMLSNIKPADGTNPYNLPPLKVIAQSQGVQQTPWFKTVVAPQLAAANASNIDPSHLLDLTRAALSEGKINIEQAAQGINTYVAAGALLNNTKKEFVKFGMPSQTSYVTEVSKINPNTRDYLISPVGAAAGLVATGKVKLNLMDPIAVKKYLVTSELGNRGILNAFEVYKAGGNKE